MQELLTIVDVAIDEAFINDRYTLDVYSYLKTINAKGSIANEFIQSTTAKNLNELIVELEEYLAGGNQQLIEAYKHVGKPKARKIKNYISKFLDDAKLYKDERKPGRKRGSKNRKRKQTTNK
jgi:hypothetical protein